MLFKSENKIPRKEGSPTMGTPASRRYPQEGGNATRPKVMNIADLPLAAPLACSPSLGVLYPPHLRFLATTWSGVLISLFLFILSIRFTQSSLAPPEPNSSWPTLSIALSEPSQIPGGVWIVLYLSAILQRLMKVGIDLRKHGDIWERYLNRQFRYPVYLKNGATGWPYYSDDRSDPGPEVWFVLTLRKKLES